MFLTESVNISASLIQLQCCMSLFTLDLWHIMEHLEALDFAISAILGHNELTKLDIWILNIRHIFVTVVSNNFSQCKCLINQKKENFTIGKCVCAWISWSHNTFFYIFTVSSSRIMFLHEYWTWPKVAAFPSSGSMQC